MRAAPDTFCRGGAAFLRFHYDSAGMFADVKIANAGLTCVHVVTVEQQAELLELGGQTLGVGAR
jgi:hypothetical protein